MQVPAEEYCSGPPRFAVCALQLLTVWSYAAGTAMVLLPLGRAFLVLWGPVREPAIARPVSGQEAAGAVVAAATGVLMLLTGMLARRAMIASKRMSVAVAGATLHIRDARGRERTIELSEVDGINAGYSWWLGVRVRLTLRSGEDVLLPQRIAHPEAFVRRLAECAGLANGGQVGRWRQYRRR